MLLETEKRKRISRHLMDYFVDLFGYISDRAFTRFIFPM